MFEGFVDETPGAAPGVPPGPALAEALLTGDPLAPAPDCRHHHVIKHLRGWTVRRDTDGSVLWTTPSGRRHRTVRPVLLAATAGTAGELAETRVDGDPPHARSGPPEDRRELPTHQPADQPVGRPRRPLTTGPTRGHDDDPPY
ncbi:hypothetical protein [Actinomycetospora cinnamomea]|uniref:Uncharacterized protein n=1 Tax=Actinomycetospora cinnamomea TaxID=663609 RepID=A0A2U1FB91_9PSEU|nr:hypothetical protein [Actinomycetospora cinnamomea]PVZ09452.1 hypothetical protein C8D89_106112 [Actinomycetospora cinnamomea]